MVSFRFRQVIAGVLVVIGLVALGNIIWVRLDYAARMPLARDPRSGRTQAIIANHGRVYVTPEEARKLDHAQTFCEWAIVMALVGTFIAQADRKRSSQAQRLGEKD
jgi:hypothetical protein